MESQAFPTGIMRQALYVDIYLKQAAKEWKAFSFDWKFVVLSGSLHLPSWSHEIPGVHFTENCSRVVTDAILHVIPPYVLNQQVRLKNYRHRDRVLIHSLRRINPHEYYRNDGRSTWIILYVQQYIDTNSVYLWPRTGCIYLVQGIHQDNYSQRGIQ